MKGFLTSKLNDKTAAKHATNANTVEQLRIIASVPDGNCSIPELKKRGNKVFDLSDQRGNVSFYMIRNIFTRKFMYMYIARRREYQ